ncbi:MAG: isoprenylcysteine carboxylmethyltransferase family protein [Candidatus Omnitrophica bacterium]|nr:isoprenylcysteine carboxylmethyltransferase family protein [Candidatus Omnitrophota bacterium]
MSKLGAFFYGIAAYAVFFASFLYAIGFTGNILVPKSIDSGMPDALVLSLVINLLLLGAFAVQHSVMARPGFKTWWTKIIPKPIERSTYVLISSLLLFLLYWQWRPLTAVVWHAAGPAAIFLQGLFWLGWAIVLVSTFMIDHFDLFGLRQTFLYWQGKPYTPSPFKKVGLYKIVRHPIMLGFIVGFWAAPQMTAGHLLFAAMTTAYILIGIWFEERDLRKFHPSDYETYRKETPALIPFFKKGSK